MNLVTQWLFTWALVYTGYLPRLWRLGLNKSVEILSIKYCITFPTIPRMSLCIDRLEVKSQKPTSWAHIYHKHKACSMSQGSLARFSSSGPWWYSTWKYTILSLPCLLSLFLYKYLCRLLLHFPMPFPVIAEIKYPKSQIQQENVYLAISLWRIQPIISWLQSRVLQRRGNTSRQQETAKATRIKLRGENIYFPTLHCKQSALPLVGESCTSFPCSPYCTGCVPTEHLGLLLRQLVRLVNFSSWHYE